MQQTPTPVAENQQRLSAKARIKRSLRARWAGYPLIAILLVTSWMVGENVGPRNRFFVERDPTISYPYVTDTVPNWTLAFIGAFGPLFLIVFTQVLIRRSPKGKYFDKRTKDIHLVIIVLGEVLSVTWLITNILKVYVGRLRPSFYAYCDYKGYRDAVASGDLTQYLANTVPGQIGSYSECLRNEPDSRFSFPSGHSSIAFCGLTFLTLFLLHVTRRIEYTHHGVGKVIRFFIVLIPLFSGALVAATRVIDYKHFVEDTVWGALIGILGAVIAFHANYSYKRSLTPRGVAVTGGFILPDNPHSPAHVHAEDSPPMQSAPSSSSIGSNSKVTPRSPLVRNTVSGIPDV